MQALPILPQDQSKATNQVRRMWSLEEDNKLRDLVEKMGPIKWKQISRLMKNRSDQQCRERWRNHLRTNINKKEWTAKEDWEIFLLQKLYGNHWVKIAKQLNDRHDSAIKNRWHSSIQKNLGKFTLLLGKAKEKLAANSEKFQSEVGDFQFALIKELREHKGDCFFSDDLDHQSGRQLNSKTEKVKVNEVKIFSSDQEQSDQVVQSFINVIQNLRPSFNQCRVMLEAIGKCKTDNYNFILPDILSSDKNISGEKDITMNQKETRQTHETDQPNHEETSATFLTNFLSNRHFYLPHMMPSVPNQGGVSSNFYQFYPPFNGFFGLPNSVSDFPSQTRHPLDHNLFHLKNPYLNHNPTLK